MQASLMGEQEDPNSLAFLLSCSALHTKIPSYTSQRGSKLSIKMREKNGAQLSLKMKKIVPISTKIKNE